jgi:hypothetical protein
MFERHLATLLPEQQQHSCVACNYNMLAYIHTSASTVNCMHFAFGRDRKCARDTQKDPLVLLVVGQTTLWTGLTQ